MWLPPIHAWNLVPLLPTQFLGLLTKQRGQVKLAQWQETGARTCTVVADAQRKGTRAKGSCTGCAIDRQGRGISGSFPESELQLASSNPLTFLFLFFVSIC